MAAHRAHQTPVVIETSGVEVVEEVTTLAPKTPSNIAAPERKLVPFADTLPRIWLKPSPFAQSA
jgi:hypothetical protein